MSAEMAPRRRLFLGLSLRARVRVRSALLPARRVRAVQAWECVK